MSRSTSRDTGREASTKSSNRNRERTIIGTPEPSSPAFRWRAHPARERCGAAALAGAVILALAGVVYLAFDSLAWGLSALLFPVLSLNRFFLPSRFSIDAGGITARYPFRRQRYAWSEVRRFLHDRNGGYLSTRGRPSRLDGFRGMHILFGDQRETVIRSIRGSMGRAAG